VRFAAPPLTRSPLSRLDPRWKLAGLILAGAAAVAVQTVPAAAAALAGALLLAALGRLPPRWLLMRTGAAVLFVGLFAAPLPFMYSVTHHDAAAGAAAAAVLICKAGAVVTLSLVLLATAPVDATLKAAHALYAPGVIVQITLLSYRYIFLLAEELGRLRIALRVRGFRNRPTWRSYRTVGVVAGCLLVRGWERAERVGQAMRCRGFDGRFRSLAAFRTTAADVVAFALMAAGAVGVWLLQWVG
jgi:cobalt/nickel transport system permease protein